MKKVGVLFGNFELLSPARISTGEVVVSSDKQIKMVNFKFANEMLKVNWFNMS